MSVLWMLAAPASHGQSGGVVAPAILSPVGLATVARNTGGKDRRRYECRLKSCDGSSL